MSAIQKLRKFKIGALFMEPGTGKTRTAIELILSTDTDYILWLTPFQTQNNLKDELSKWGVHNVHVHGIESLSSSDVLFLNLINNLKSSKSPFVVVDESLKIKNWEAKRTKRIIELGKLAEYKLILNGTPISRNILDVWAQMEFLSPLILNMSMAEFKNTFCEYIKIKKSGIVTKEFIKKYHNIDYLYSLICHYVYESDLKLQIKQQWVNLDYSIQDDIKSQYNELKSKYLDDSKMQFLTNNIFLELTQKMQHIYCCSPTKFFILDKIVKIHGIENVIVFTKYISSNKEVANQFNGIRVLSYQKDSFGLNLQQYKVTVFFDKIWDYSLRIQATRRTFRTGQKEDCMYYDLTGDVGLESMINKNIDKKCDMVEYLKQKSINQIKKEL
jgi:SNF2 family DNA or RNA helicase